MAVLRDGGRPMTDPLHTETSAVNHFGVLVEYLSEYPQDQRESLAERYGAEGEDPARIARRWCREPEAFVATVEEKIGGTLAEEALRELVYEHDMPLDLDWMGASAEQRLIEVGLLNEFATSPFREWEVEFPGALAAMLAGFLEDTRPSLAILLGQSDRERLDGLAREYDLAETGSRIEVILRLMDHFAAPNTIEEILGRISDPDWLGSAIMVLELGGVCYWQEVFGYEFGGEPEAGEGEVVPLMREEERYQERRMAETLVEIGLLHRFEAVETDHAMVAVPEELWHELWNVGRGWLLEWTRRSFRDLRDRGTSGGGTSDAPHLQSVGKWLVCEAATGELTLEDGRPNADVLDRLTRRAGRPDWDLESYMELLFELSILRRGVDGFITLGAEYQKLLDMDRKAFVRDVLYEWCGGFVGGGFDERLPKAFGLDERWREQAVEILRARREFIPQWMEFEGVDQERTGAGCLREATDDNPELVARELSILNGYVLSAKMVWLDLLTLLSRNRRYPLQGIVELEQMNASVCLFSQLGRLLEDPREYFYLPVQRASFLTDPFHTSEFEGWIGDVVDRLFEPLGVGSRDEESVLLTDVEFRIDSPPGWSLRDREQLVGEVVERDDFEFPGTRGDRRPLEAVEAPSESDRGGFPRRVELDAPIDDILEAAHGRGVEAFEGDAVVFEPPITEAP